MEARIHTSNGHASVSVKQRSWRSSFGPALCQDILWPFIAGFVSVLALSFKFMLRYAPGQALGYLPPTSSLNLLVWSCMRSSGGFD